ncbi:hypothetical protein [Pseudochrobactrum asaccharolyticum]|uniref:Uncharacterized protein n=1 Tax=Pseudochrobactrum asaccharolyticum TaxID=354351 RepID=A0A366DLK9_9HYPH|nr:hypothetical protein [Pseudochrobactrum asaccharolyticum]RBO90972.1 hypothetical protein DFR47_11167 [Pseudochrobactrum asaccharolyticum]
MSNRFTSKILTGLMLVAALSLSQPLSAKAGPAEGDLEGAKLSGLLQQSGIQCSDAKGLNCSAGNYEVTIHSDCAVAPYYGAIYGGPAKLSAGAGGSDQNVVATLAEDQLVCIKATAKTGISDAEYFIMAMPIDRFDKCDGVDVLCRVSAPLSEPYRTTMENCKQLKSGKILSCPQGWVQADAIEPYPNGLE